MRVNGEHRKSVTYRLAFTAELEHEMRGMNHAEREAFLNARVAALAAERDALDADINEVQAIYNGRMGME